MRENWTLTKAFASFDGAKPKNIRRAWSARSSDGRIVVITLWKDEIKDDGHTVRVDHFGDQSPPPWKDAPGNKQRIKDLEWARDHCDGLFRVVMVVAKDTKAVPRSIAKRYPDLRLLMKLICLNEVTGEFRAQGTRDSHSPCR